MLRDLFLETQHRDGATSVIDHEARDVTDGARAGSPAMARGQDEKNVRAAKLRQGVLGIAAGDGTRRCANAMALQGSAAVPRDGSRLLFIEAVMMRWVVRRMRWPVMALRDLFYQALRRVAIRTDRLDRTRVW